MAKDSAKEFVEKYFNDEEFLKSFYNNGGIDKDASDEDYCQYYISGTTKGKWNDLNGTQVYPFVVQIGNWLYLFKDEMIKNKISCVASWDELYNIVTKMKN